LAYIIVVTAELALNCKYFGLGLGPFVDWEGQVISYGSQRPFSHKLGGGELGVICLVGGMG
jgi:hypothetical protein